MTVLGGLRRRGHQVRPQSRRCRAVVDGPSPKHRRTSRRTRACIGHPSSRRGSFDAVRLTFEPQKFVRRSCASIRSRASLYRGHHLLHLATSMSAFLGIASQVLVLIFVLTTLFSVGLLVSVRQVLGGLQQRRSLALALCANFVVLPATALALCWALQLTPAIQAALLLAATAPGSPALLRLNEFARGDQARAVGLLVVLTSLTVAYQPLVLPMLLPGLDVSPMPIARALVLTVLLPLVLGLLLKVRWPGLAARLRPALARVGNISALLSCFILLPLAYRDALMDVVLNGGGLLVLLLYLPLAVGAGWWLGGPDADKRRLLALCCGQGSMGAAFVIAAGNFNDPHVIAMLLLILYASLAVLIPLAMIFRRRSELAKPHPARATVQAPVGVHDAFSDPL